MSIEYCFFHLFPLCLHLHCNDGNFSFHQKYVVSVCTCWKALDAEANTIDDCVHIYIPIKETHDMLFSQYISQNICRRDSRVGVGGLLMNVREYMIL